MAKLTPAACRAGRALLKWGVRDLASEAGLSQATVVAFEAGKAHISSTAEAISAAFAAAGVEITNGTGTGAKLLNDRPTPPVAKSKKTAPSRKSKK